MKDKKFPVSPKEVELLRKLGNNPTATEWRVLMETFITPIKVTQSDQEEERKRSHAHHRESDDRDGLGCMIVLAVVVWFLALLLLLFG